MQPAAKHSGGSFNVNVGLLGHIDCGKTSLAKALSTHLSTAAIDKHPQSQERGITLDLGFSSFTEEAPERVKLSTGCDRLRFTLVDCPGHASLIRTVLGGAQIIDMMLLVVDAKEGIQTQTAECIVVGEILGPDLVIVLNKCDLLESQEEVEEAKRKLRKALKRTAFAESPMIAVSAAPSCEPSASTGISELISEMVARAPADKRDTSGKFLFAADHCFAVKGQGTVLTGTILRGQVEVGNQVEVPALKAVRKVKSLQMFKEPAKRAVKGDRVALCLPQVDAGAIERGFVAAPESIKPLKGCVASAVKVRYYKASVQTGAKFHVTIGHATVLATVTFFCEPRNERPERAHRVSQLGHAERADNFDSDLAYLLCGELSPEGEERSQSGDEQGPQQEQGPQFCLLTFGQPVICDPHALYIASKLDTDTDARACRLAFYGKIAFGVDPTKQEELQRLRVYKNKEKWGVVERLEDGGYGAICKGMFKKGSDISKFEGLRVVTDDGGTAGKIAGSFGRSGKFRVQFDQQLSSKPSRVILRFRRYLYDPEKRMRQHSG